MPNDSDTNRPSSQSVFDTKHLMTDLKARAVRGGIATMLGQGDQFIIQIASTIIMARLLVPADFGLIAMVTAITGFAILFKDLGLSMATVQRSKITHEQVSTLFWINVTVSTVITLVIFGLAPAIAWFYGEPRLTLITMVLSLVFVLGGLTVQHQALMQREMRFKALAIIRVISILAGLIAAIAFALIGISYWALVIMQITTAMFNTAGVWLLCHWRPSHPFRRVDVKDLLVFGANLTGFDIVNYFARNLDNILLGRFWGANVLGLYSKAYSIMMLPINQIRAPLNAVAIPTLSRLQNDPIRFERYYIKLITLIAFISMPLMTILFVCADQVIYLLLGSQWLGATDIFKLLCINAFIQPVSTTWGLVLVSLGQSKKYFMWGIINSVIISISFILGLPWGGIGVAAAYTIVSYGLLLPTLWYCFRQAPVSMSGFFSAIFRPTIASIVMGLVIFVLRSYFNFSYEILSLVFSAISGSLTYLIAFIILPGGLLILRDLYSYRLLLFKKEAS